MKNGIGGLVPCQINGAEEPASELPVLARIK
jgi:hypothetical protein